MEEELSELGVKKVVVPRRGRANAERRKLQSSKRFVTLVKWRTGSEGRIAHLKHSWGWNRTRIDGIDGARTWCGWGVLAHNATKIAALIDERDNNRRRPRPTARGPCRRAADQGDLRRLIPRPTSRSRPECRKRQKSGAKSTGRVRIGAQASAWTSLGESGDRAYVDFFRSK